MEVFLMVRRKKTTLFLDAKETSFVHEVKKIIEGITKTPPSHQQLYKDGEVMEDDRILADYGLTHITARAQSPATVGLTYKQTDGNFEPLEMTSYSQPPALPHVMQTGNRSYQ